MLGALFYIFSFSKSRVALLLHRNVFAYEWILRAKNP